MFGQIKKWLIVLVLGFLVVSVYGVHQVEAGKGEYPEGVINFASTTERSLNIKSGDKVDFTVKMTKSKKLCKVYVMYYKSDTRKPKTTNNLANAVSLTVTRGQADSYDLKGSLSTTGLPNGSYRLFIYGDQSCDYANPWGNEDNEFACDGNPSCSAYCGQKQRPASPDGGPDEPGDLYRTSSNPAYYATYGSAQCAPGNTAKVSSAPQNSCGEISGGPSCDEPSFADPSRVGECEIKACDPSGKGFDNLTFVVGSGGGNVSPSPSSVGSANPSTSPAVSSSPVSSAPVSTDVTLGATNKGGQVKADVLSIDLKNKQLNLTAGLRSTANNEFVGPDLLAKIGSGVSVGGKNVVLTKAVNLSSNIGGLTLNNGESNVLANIPDNTTIMGSDTWDGKIKLSPVATSGTDVPVGYKVKGQAVEIGSSLSSLVLSKPALVTFNGADCDWSASNVTCDVSYKSAGSTTWTNISKCSSDVANDASKLAFGKECYVPDYNTKQVRIWTYHFSLYANFSVDQPVSFLMALPQVCLDKSDTSKLLLQFQFGVNPAYENVIQAFTKCSSRISCDGQEQLLTDWKNVNANQRTVDSVPIMSSIYGIKVGDMIKFRVGGVLKGNTVPANIADLPEKYWSQPVFKRVSSCDNRGNGITIEELIISPQGQ